MEKNKSKDKNLSNDSEREVNYYSYNKGVTFVLF